jgi:phosphate/sulfate permease
LSPFATRALPPRVAVGLAAVLNFVGAFISVTVAATIAKGIVDQVEGRFALGAAREKS